LCLASLLRDPRLAHLDGRAYLPLVERLVCLDLEADVDRVAYDERVVRLGVFPMGIDVASFAAPDDGEAAREIAAAVKPDPSARILLGIDRLDYTKGIRRRLLAFGRFLEKYPEWKGRVRFVQVAVPSREKVDEYVRFRREVDEIVGRVNGAHATLAGPPVHYLHRSFDARELRALYRAADVCVVTPLRDGMNLVAKEFVAARVDDDGVLVLSEFAGAAAELGEALIVNPYDVDATADAYARALAMPREERRVRMRALRRRVGERDVRTWAEDFVRTLTEAPEHPPETPDRTRARDASETAAELGAAAELVVFLDYDGTLTGFRTSPELAAPDGALLLLLRALAAAPGVAVHIVSGRRREDLETWFAGLPLGLHAEHGAWSRDPEDGEWRSFAALDDGWKERVRPYLAQAAGSTPGSFVEEKAAGLAWHWRAADPEFGALQARELRLHLSDLLANSPIEVLTGVKVIEVRHHAAHKGTAVARVLAGRPPGVRALAVGDDRTDEDLFRALPRDGVAVRVGAGPSRAAHRLAYWREVRAFLAALAARRGG
jgi:trehalose 6-phosphate synthase/phosphatase